MATGQFFHPLSPFTPSAPTHTRAALGRMAPIGPRLLVVDLPPTLMAVPAFRLL